MKRFLIVLDILFVALYVGVMFALDHLGSIPRTISVLNLFLLGLASARLSDIISTDEIMTWLREPFVRMETEEVADREVRTRTGRGVGIRKTIGDLLSCPWCVGVWVAAGLTYAYYLWPTGVWLLILLLAIAEVGSIFQTISTILVRLEKYMKALGVPDEGL